MPTVTGATGCTLEYATVIAYESVDIDSATVTTRINSYVTIGAEYVEGGSTYKTV